MNQQDQIKNDKSHRLELPSLSVVVPCFNEDAGIEQLSNKLSELKQDYGNLMHFEFIFVDDGSTDHTWAQLEKYFLDWSDAILVQHEENRGLMAAVQTGFGQASNEFLFSMDSDCTYCPLQIPEFIPILQRESVGVVTGSPYHPDGAVLNVPKWRITISKTASWLYSFLLRNKLHCYTSMFRGWKKSAIEEIELNETGYAGTVEILWSIEQRGWDIDELPSVLNVRKYGQSKMRLLKVIRGHLKFMLRLLFRRVTGRRSKLTPLAVEQKN